MKKILILGGVLFTGLVLIALLVLFPKNLDTPGIASEPPTFTPTPSSQPTEEQPTAAPPTIEVVTPTEKPAAIPNLYDCKLEMAFTSGPLAGKDSQFIVLGQNYFYDKGEKFYPGKNTAVYYEDPPYLLLHSAYENGNLLKPLEAEFMRFFLEQWGELTPLEIENNIQALLGSEVIWDCNGEFKLTTTIHQVVRLSNKASEQLWLAPWQMETILEEKAGLSHEWLGEMSEIESQSLYLAFCGWGPEDVGETRIFYYRYLIQFARQP